MVDLIKIMVNIIEGAVDKVRVMVRLAIDE